MWVLSLLKHEVMSKFIVVWISGNSRLTGGSELKIFSVETIFPFFDVRSLVGSSYLNALLLFAVLKLSVEVRLTLILKVQYELGTHCNKNSVKTVEDRLTRALKVRSERTVLVCSFKARLVWILKV